MKKTGLFFAMMFAIIFSVNAQVVFDENFDAVTDGGMPTGWTIFNVDGLTPATNVNWVTDAWVCYAKAGFAIESKCAWSTSWYTSAATSNDYMFTPAITIPATNPFLQYLVVAQDPSYPDGYQVLVMTTAPASGNLTTATVLNSYTAAETTPTLKSIDLSAYAGQSVYLGWRNNSNDKFLLAVDDVKVVSLANIDAQAVSINTNNYVLVGNTNITGTIRNNGVNNITSYDVTYTIDGGAPSAVYSVTGANIALGATATFTHNVPANLASGSHTVEVTISNVNGGTDGNTTDNIVSKTVTAISSIPAKRVVGEEATGTWCGYCVRGIVYMDYMAATYPSTWIGIAVHNGDPMVVSAYDTGIGNYIGGYPSGLVDRGVEADPADFEDAYTAAMAKVVPVEVSLDNIYFNYLTRQITYDVVATFVADMNVDCRINGVVVENDVTGTTSGYNQVNYYSGGSLGAMGGFESMPDPIPAADMHYDFVARALLGGWDGTAGSIPTSVVNGTPYTQSYTYTLPATYDETQIVLVGMVIDQTTGEILNAVQGDIVLGVEEAHNSDLIVYPNPTSGVLYLYNSVFEKVEVYDSFGQLVIAKTNTDQIDLSSLANGNYFVKAINNEIVITKQIIVSK